MSYVSLLRTGFNCVLSLTLIAKHPVAYFCSHAYDARGPSGMGHLIIPKSSMSNEVYVDVDVDVYSLSIANA
jgi:hypothetical protein